MVASSMKEFDGYDRYVDLFWSTDGGVFIGW